jgi:hypothetical protein
VVALLRYFGPLGGWLTLAWIVVVSGLMLMGSVGRSAIEQHPDSGGSTFAQ